MFINNDKPLSIQLAREVKTAYAKFVYAAWEELSEDWGFIEAEIERVYGVTDYYQKKADPDLEFAGILSFLNGEDKKRFKEYRDSEFQGKSNSVAFKLIKRLLRQDSLFNSLPSKELDFITNLLLYVETNYLSPTYDDEFNGESINLKNFKLVINGGQIGLKYHKTNSLF